MSYLGRRGAASPLTSGDIPADVVQGTDIAYLENDSTTQNLGGTYSTERMYLNDSYTLTDNVTVTGHLALGSIADSDVVITNDSSARTITGPSSGSVAGVIEAGRLMNDFQSSLTGMTGELGNGVTLGSAVTGSPNLNLTTGTLGSGIVFPAGHIIQTTPSAYGDTQTSMPVNGSDAWTDTVITTSITPLYNDSSILLFSNFMYYWNDSTGDSGLGLRIKKVHSGGTSYPTTMDTYKGSGSVYSAGYHNLDPGDNGIWLTYSAQDPTVGVASSSVSYTINAWAHNVANNAAVGGSVHNRWWIFLQEVKR